MKTNLPGSPGTGGSAIRDALHRKHVRWFLVWTSAMAVVWLWDALFLNRPAFLQIQRGTLHSTFAAVAVVFFSLLLGWGTGITLYFLERRNRRFLYLSLTFILNVARSIPQIVGMLTGYIALTLLMRKGFVTNPNVQILWMALIISMFAFQDLADVVRERIAHYQRTDFFYAMLGCGISEPRIVNQEILWKNSLGHIVHKLISIFGMAIFLQCSIDFLISVGLSTEVSLTNFPETLGSVLASMDSKQDVLAISTVFSDISYVRALLFTHLQGISISFIQKTALTFVSNIKSIP